MSSNEAVDGKPRGFEEGFQELGSRQEVVLVIAEEDLAGKEGLKDPIGRRTKSPEAARTGAPVT